MTLSLLNQMLLFLKYTLSSSPLILTRYKRSDALDVRGIIHSDRMNEKATRTSEKARSGFINDTVLMPEVLAMIISFPRTIRIRKIKTEMRNASGRIRWMYEGDLSKRYRIPSEKLAKDFVNNSMCSKKSIVRNIIIPANSVKSSSLTVLRMIYLSSLFKAMLPIISYFVGNRFSFFLVDILQKIDPYSGDNYVGQESGYRNV